MMRPKLKDPAACGFCRLWGQDNVCNDCEIRRIRESLDTLVDKALWEHDHKFCGDDDTEVRNCAHCSHAISFDTLYHAAQYQDELYCAMDADDKGDGTIYYRRHPATHVCDCWTRAVPVGGGAV